MKNKRKIYIFDTTLRDGEQSPGASLTPDEKLKVARQLERLNVDVIEAGSAAASDGERDAIRLIADGGLSAEICTFVRALRTDIDNERLKQEDYRQLAELIGSNMASIVKNCRLPQNADKAFHNIVLADINWGRETMLTATNVKAQRAGTLAVIQALRNYGEHFDHPGWTVDGPR